MAKIYNENEIDAKKAYKKLLEIKERPINKAFPIMCADEK